MKQSLFPWTSHNPSAAGRRPAHGQDRCTPVRGHPERNEELGPSLSSGHSQAWGRKVPRSDTWVPKVERGGKAARRIQNPELGGQAEEGSQANPRRVSGGPAGAPEGRPLSRCEVKQTVLPILPRSCSPSGKLLPSSTKLYARLCSPGEVAAREGLSLPVPADSQLIGP